MEITARERRAYIYARIRAAFDKLAGRSDFDFSGEDSRINYAAATRAQNALDDAITKFVDGGCPAEEVQRAWVEYAKAHQLREPEPLTLFGKESESDERSEQATAPRGRGAATERGGDPDDDPARVTD